MLPSNGNVIKYGFFSVIGSVMSYAAFVVIVVSFWVVAYWYFVPVNVLEIGDIVLKTPRVVAGECLEYSIELEKFEPVAGQLIKQLVRLDAVDSKEIYNLSDITGNLAVGKHKIQVNLHIPNHTTPGVYRLRATVRYQVNPLREQIYIYRVEPIEVISEKCNGNGK